MSLLEICSSSLTSPELFICFDAFNNDVTSDPSAVQRLCNLQLSAFCCYVMLCCYQL